MFLGRYLFPLHESPKYLLGRGRDAEVVVVVQKIAAFNKATTWLTLEHFQAIDSELALGNETHEPQTRFSDTAGIVKKSISKFSPEKLKGLFSTPKMAFSTSMMILLWCMVSNIEQSRFHCIEYRLHLISKWPRLSS